MVTLPERLASYALASAMVRACELKLRELHNKLLDKEISMHECAVAVTLIGVVRWYTRDALYWEIKFRKLLV
jgi:hypothetical protein